LVIKFILFRGRDSKDYKLVIRCSGDLYRLKTWIVPFFLEVLKMKYYDEKKSKHIRLALEKVVLEWPQVTTKIMFGCPAYLADGNLFALTVTAGVVINHLDREEKTELEHHYPAGPFQAGKRTIKKWIKVPVTGEEEIKPLVPFLRKSYQSALTAD
jgi:hypothetical protein